MAGSPSKPSKKKSISSRFRSVSKSVTRLLKASKKNSPLSESSKSKRHTPPQRPPPPTKKANSPAAAQSKKTSVAAAKSPATAKSKKTSPAAAKSNAPAAATAAKSNSPAAAKSPASANVEHCRKPENRKNPRQHKLEKLLFTGDRSFKADVKKLDLEGDNIKIEITNEKNPLENYRLNETKRLGKGAYGSVFLLNEVRSDKKEPVSIVIKCMVGDEEIKIAEDLKKADCDILRLSFIKQEESREGQSKKKVRKINGYFIAFMDKAEGHLYDIPSELMPIGSGYYTKGSKFAKEIIKIGNQIFTQLKCLYNLNDKPSEKYLYTDLKPTNCLYYCKGESPIKVQLGDLGSAVWAYSDKEEKKFRFMSTYTAPEIRNKDTSGHFYVELEKSEECGRILAYQLGFLIVSLVEGPKYTIPYGFDIEFDQGKHKELEAKAEEILPGLSQLIKEEPDKRINILDEKYETFGDILEDAAKK